MTDYDPALNLEDSIAHGLAAVRKRIANGGPPWTPRDHAALREYCIRFGLVQLSPGDLVEARWAREGVIGTDVGKSRVKLGGERQT